MPTQGPAAAARHTVANFPLDASPRDAKAVLAEACLTLLWCSDESIAAEKAERWVVSYLRVLRRELDTANRLGRPSRYAFNSSSDYMVQGACFVEPSDSAELKLAKGQRLNYLQHLAWLRDLEPVAFERACSGIIKLLGCADASVTSRSADQGIDFFGRLKLQGRLERVYLLETFDRSMDVWLVGQAKRYRAVQVATPDLRELVGSIELARTRTFVGSGHGLQELRIRPCDPIFYLFVTTGSISADGWELLEKAGVIGLDGLMVAAFLADNDIGVTDGAFSSDAADAWVAAC
jgi:Restriction endonuclease